MTDRIDLAAARSLVSGYAPEEAVSVKAGSVLALIDAVEAAHALSDTPLHFTGTRDVYLLRESLRQLLDRFTFGGDAAA